MKAKNKQGEIVEQEKCYFCGQLTTDGGKVWTIESPKDEGFAVPACENCIATAENAYPYGD